MKLEKELSNYVENIIDKVEIEKSYTKKIIIDPIYGSQYLYPWEVNVVNLPFVQRLRRINQMGLAYVVYPGATHTRFEHSLGTLYIANIIFNALRETYPSLVDPNLLYTVRMAAILHDIGHGPFSHTSEVFIKQYPEIKEKLSEKNFLYLQPHELLSYLMVSSEPFQIYLENLSHKYDIRLMTKEVANFIIGSSSDEQYRGFLSEIINGYQIPDADRLDYMVRDSYFTGLNTSIDVNQIIQSFIASSREDRNELHFFSNVIPIFEQMLFNKALLYSYIYHNEFIRSLEAPLIIVFEKIFSDHELINNMDINNIVNMLKLDDYQVISHKSPDKRTALLIENLRNGKGMKTALSVSPNTIRPIKDVDKLAKLRFFNLIGMNHKEILNLRSLISSEVGNKCSIYDVFIDLPTPPRFRETVRTNVENEKGKVMSMNQLFPLDNWLSALVESHWAGYLFSTEEYFEQIRNSAIKIIEEIFEISFAPINN